MRRQPATLWPESAYDANLCLKPPPLLWVVVVYLSREFTLPFAMGAAQFAGIGKEAVFAMRHLWNWDLTVLPSLLALAVLIALFRRVPNASRAMRWIWAHGVTLLACAAIGDFLIAAASVFRAGELNDGTLLQGIGAAMDLGCLAYVLLSARTRDAFAEFPLAPQSP